MAADIDAFNAVIAKNSESSAARTNEGYADSSANPAFDCSKIRAAAPYKKNGFYWLKTKCMPKALRVYCDFDKNNPNFYAYHGFTREKKAVLDNIKN